MIEVDFNNVGMIIFYCNHVKGYDKGKGNNICNRCQLRIKNKIMKIINKPSSQNLNSSAVKRGVK